jgi:hypothetical protein
MPDGLLDALAVVAATFHFSATELWDMELREVAFWFHRAKWWHSKKGA